MQLKIVRGPGLTDKQNEDFNNNLRDGVWKSITGQGSNPIPVYDAADKHKLVQDLHILTQPNVGVMFEGGNFRIMTIQSSYVLTKRGEKPDATMARSFYATINLMDDTIKNE